MPDSDEFDKYVSTSCAQSYVKDMTFRVINDVASADTARRDLLGKTAGVMRVVKDFALGLDLKGA